ncbi:MAG: flavin oxidoreductase/NADH oxidase [Firmicutes bacterium]|jgi:2,4-dienoyl-CoA reductase-like NADH-dependent reductase (Old Yellow Enzyme family)|nr:flavin oxidoreductase/NADH oxidase [Bacillota bacterium]
MSAHRRFSYSSPEDLARDIARLGLEKDIPLADDVGLLLTPAHIGRSVAPNRLAIHPMEGCDGTSEGKPGELTTRRCLRFAQGGAGLIWFEAAAILNEARANPRQLLMVKENLPEMKLLVAKTVAAAEEEFGHDHTPLCLIQLTHSGRYSKPKPIFAVHNPYLDPPLGIDETDAPCTDAYIEALVPVYVRAAEIARDAGFAGVDIKSCHRYLISELLSARTRTGRYGGDFDCRTRLVRETAEAIVRAVGHDMMVATRMNVYDALPHPYGWGTSDTRPGHPDPDLSEPIRLARILRDTGVSLINVTFGNPYYNPHISRPFDTGPYVPPEHPLERIAVMLRLTEEIKRAVPEVTVVGTGYSWLRHLAPFVASGVLSRGGADVIGFGRMSFAYPDFARDLMREGRMELRKSCTTCSSCTVMMRDGMPTGCPVRDKEVYLPIYKKGREGKPPASGTEVKTHI